MKLRLAIMSLAAVASLAICLEIEFLNRQAGGVLPRERPKHSGNPKWRVLALPEQQLSKEYERQYRAEKNLEDNEPLPEEVVETIRANVSAEAPRYRAEGQLKGVVSTWGLLQYPLSVLLIVSGLVHLGANTNWKIRPASLAVAAIGCVCFGMALCRGYFSSLGW